MDLFQAIETRRSVRAFEASPVAADDLDRILEACTRAPSAGNLQAFEIGVVEAPERKDGLARAAYDQDCLRQAPVVLVFSAHAALAKRYGDRGAELYAVQDATISAAYAQLAAVARGLATCWIGSFDERAVAESLGLAPELRPVVLMPLGSGAEDPAPSPRRTVADLVRRL